MDRKSLRDKIFALMDEVNMVIESGMEIDDFLDQTNLFDDWEKIIPESEYPIFVISVLNNIRKESILETILSSILIKSTQSDIDSVSCQKQNKLVSHLGELPFN